MVDRALEALRAGGAVLLLVFAIAIVAHALRGQFPGTLLVYAAGTAFDRTLVADSIRTLDITYRGSDGQEFYCTTGDGTACLDADKRYVATLQLGETRVGGDLEGEVIERRPVSVTAPPGSGWARTAAWSFATTTPKCSPGVISTSSSIAARSPAGCRAASAASAVMSFACVRRGRV